MEPVWYVQTEGGEIEGPLAPAALKTRADSGIVKPDTRVRKGTHARWVAASKVKGLFAASPTPAPPPSSTPGDLARGVGEGPRPPGANDACREDGGSAGVALAPTDRERGLSLFRSGDPPSQPEAGPIASIPSPPPTRSPSTRAAAAQWYVTIEGEQKGPLTDPEMRRWVAQGKVQPETFVRVGADGEWTAAGDFTDLFENVAAPVAPLAPGKAPRASVVQSPAIETLGRFLGYLCVPVLLVVGAGLSAEVATSLDTKASQSAATLLIYLLVWCVCGGALGAIIGSFKQAGLTGAMLGACFGPLGVIATFAIDGRLQCGRCGGKLDGQPEICPHCRELLGYKSDSRSQGKQAHRIWPPE
jgi:hypothetical protein